MAAENSRSFYREVMAECVRRAETGSVFTGANPRVGAAVVKNGRVVSYGVHEYYGGPHAEVNAIAAAGSDALGSELVVTLEPCSTSGKTPPCTAAIIRAGIKKVWVGVLDPNPLHAGNGLKELERAGVEIAVGIERESCARLIEDFAKSKLTGMPYVTLKIASSADGKIACRSGDSKWITGPESRIAVHRSRGESGAVLIGAGAALSDDPELTDRRAEASRQPVRAVLDGMASLSLDSRLVRSVDVSPVFLYVSESAPAERVQALRERGVKIFPVPRGTGGLDLEAVLKSLYAEGAATVLCEGGASVFGSMNDGDYADALDLFIAPRIIGGAGALSSIGGVGSANMSAARRFEFYSCEKLGHDVRLRARFKDYSSDIVSLTDAFVSGRKG